MHMPHTHSSHVSPVLSLEVTGRPVSLGEGEEALLDRHADAALRLCDADSDKRDDRDGSTDTTDDEGTHGGMHALHAHSRVIFTPCASCVAARICSCLVRPLRLCVSDHQDLLEDVVEVHLDGIGLALQQVMTGLGGGESLLDGRQHPAHSDDHKKQAVSG